MKDTCIKETTEKGIRFFEAALAEYVTKTHGLLRSIEKAQAEVGLYWKDEQYEATEAEIKECLALRGALARIDALSEWVGERRRHFAEAVAMLEDATIGE